MSNIPNIEAVGSYILNEPFTTPDGAVYSCEGIKSFDALEKAGEDIYAVYYAPYGLSQEIYATDADNDVKIVTLLSLSGDPDITVPSSYIEGYPAVYGEKYSNLVLAINVGPVSDTMALTTTQSAIREIVAANLGIETEVELLRVPMLEQLTNDEIIRLEQVRAARRQFRQSPASQLQYWMDRTSELETKIALLEEALISTELP